jgi:hypothetical protein
MSDVVKQVSLAGNSAKRKGLKRTHTLTVMLTPEERRELEKLARREGLGAGSWVRSVVRRMAREIKQTAAA